MVKFPVFENFDLTESEKAEVNKKLASLSQEQRDIAIQAISTANMEDDIVYIRGILSRGMKGELKPFKSSSKQKGNTTHNPKQETLFTPISGENNAVSNEEPVSEEEAKARDRAERIRIAKKYIEKGANKEVMLNDFKRMSAVYIGGHGAFFEPELRAAGLFD
ncbi:hypothetical protein MTYP_03246 [Methylophilaceae bacterium]|nr:hypothetical protein MTYP_03246 [Methylophilaceae bacterium]